MHKQEHVLYLQEKHRELKLQFLNELKNGRNLVLLRSLSAIIITINQEIVSFQGEAREKVATNRDASSQ